MSENHDVLVEKRRTLGLITLNRPQEQNVLSLQMLRRIKRALDDFGGDDAIRIILIASVGRIFSAGGDVYRIVAEWPGPEFERFRREYFRTEFALDFQIHTCAKPVVVLLDGITMGGGCGLALHARHVVATERTILSMPETGIGYFPDVGAAHFLNRMPGHLGIYIGLRGLRLGPGDVVALALASHHIRSERRDRLTDALAAMREPDPAAITDLLGKFASDPGPSAVAPRRQRVDELFAGSTVEDIIEALAVAPEPWAEAALATLRHVCPMSLKVALQSLRSSRGISLAEALRRDYRICMRMTARSDFREGVRAVLVDKDNRPNWQPGRLEAIDPAAVEACFAPLAPAEPELDLG